MLSIAQCDSILTAPGAVLEMETVVCNGSTQRVWKRCPTTFESFFRHSLSTYSSRLFIIEPSHDVRLTFGQIYTRARALGADLQSRGFGQGSRIAIGGRNSAQWIICFIAVQLIGGVAVCLNAWQSTQDLYHCIELAGVQCVYADAELAQRLQECSCLVAWEHSNNLDCKLEPTHIQPDDDAVIFFSSGTGGPPKAVLSTQRMALTNLWSGLVAPARSALRAGRPIPPLPKLTDPQKVVLLSIPLFHVTGCLSWLMRAIFAGSRMILLPNWNVESAIEAISSEGVTAVGGVPAVVEAILRSPSLPQENTIESCFYGGAPPREALAGEVREKWPNVGLVQGYGLTETNAYVCSIAGLDYIQRPTSCGPPVPICDVRIVHPVTREPTATGRSGLLLVRGPQVMKCYVGDESATRRAVDCDGWLDTGDIASVDQEGFVYIRDRLKDIIIRGGENIASTDVENALSRHPAVLEAVAVGVPDDVLGEQVGAMVSVQVDLTEHELVSWARKSLPVRMIPIIILVSNKPLPRNVNGKVTKLDIKRQVAHEWASRKTPLKSKL